MNPGECKCAIEKVLLEPFSRLSFVEKQNIVKEDRPTPDLPKLTQVKKQNNKTITLKFNKNKYTEISWLSGCPKLNKLYCWPCLLFNVKKSSWNCDGVSDLNNLGNVLRQRHQLSKEHLGAVVSLKEFTKAGNSRIDTSLSQAHKLNVEKHNAEVSNNRYILKNLIDATCFLALQELSFRGHDETQSSSNRGNYKELLSFMSQKDPKLKHHLETNRVFTGETSIIQNDLIESCKEHLLNNIRDEILQSKFVAIIVDETSDISRKAQLSVVFRYIDQQNQIQERFIRYVDVSENKSADRLQQVVIDHLKEFNCIEKLVAQTYDGASVNTGQFKGLAAQVKNVCPQALFTHCYAHKLNLVLQNSVKNIKECNIFFSTVSGFASFFSNSTKRTHYLDEIVKKHFPTVAPTRWLYNNRLVETIYENKQVLIELFDYIIENVSIFDPESRYCASGFKKNLLDLEFNFFLEIFHLILPKAEFLFKILQKKAIDITFCDAEVQQFANAIGLLRATEFDSIWSKLNDSADVNPPKKRQRLSGSDNDMEASYRRLFFEVLDNVLMHLQERFNDLTKLKFFSLIDSEKFENFNKLFPSSTFQDLMKSPYGQYFNGNSLEAELSYIYSSSSFRHPSLSNFNDYLVSNDLTGTFIETHKLIHLVLTIPATSVSAERSFSALKRIKTYTRNSTTQNRLNGLALLCIEKQLFKTLMLDSQFYDSVIKIFASKKDRRIQLSYK